MKVAKVQVHFGQRDVSGIGKARLQMTDDAKDNGNSEKGPVHDSPSKRRERIERIQTARRRLRHRWRFNLRVIHKWNDEHADDHVVGIEDE